jgi:hypothetical protein
LIGWDDRASFIQTETKLDLQEVSSPYPTVLSKQIEQISVSSILLNTSLVGEIVSTRPSNLYIIPETKTTVYNNNSNIGNYINKSYFNYNSNRYHQINKDNNCEYNLIGCALFNNKGYVIYSALGSFYIPMFVMIFFYWRIYLIANRTSCALKIGYKTTKCNGSQEKCLTLR